MTHSLSITMRKRGCDMVVKTFNDDVINRLINQAEPELSKYIKAQKSVIENGKKLTSEAVSKIKNLHAENERLKAELADSLPLGKVKEIKQKAGW